MKNLFKNRKAWPNLKFQFCALSSLLFSLSLSLNAHANKMTTDHTVQIPLEALSVGCEWDDIHRVYKVALDLSEATITPEIRFLSSNTIYSTSSNGLRSYDQCVRAVRDIHLRYPHGSSFVIRRTIQESWKSGCRNDRCPSVKTTSESVIGNFDGRLFSSDRWD